NTEVKLFSADGSRGFPPVRVGRRQAIITVKAAHYELPFLFLNKNKTNTEIRKRPYTNCKLQKGPNCVYNQQLKGRLFIRRWAK
ncbi:hypothetical protein C2145_20295, partial [Bacillus velezensis]